MVLCIGVDRHALRQRYRALRRAGYLAEAVHLKETSQALARRTYDAIVIGRKIPDDEARMLSSTFRERCPEGRVIVLHQGWRDRVEFADAVIAYEEDSANLIETLRTVGVEKDGLAGERSAAPQS